MSLLTTLIIIGSVGWGWTRPILPLPYQLVYLSPDPYGYHIAAPPQPILTNRVSEEHGEGSPEDDDKSYEVTQFHTEDDAGRIVYGFHSPDQIRMEEREPDGTVRGSYSYVDPFGNIVKMQYWDEGNGIHMAGNNLPVAFHSEPQYTPEVRAAREEHFRLYAAALATLKAAGLDDSPEKEPERYPSGGGGDYEEEPNSQSSEEIAEEEEPPKDDSVIVENPSAEREPPQQSSAEFQAKPMPPHSYDRPANLPEPDSDDEESIAIENPELFRTDWARKAKSSQESDLAQQARLLEGLRQQAMDFASSMFESRSVKHEEPQEDKTSQKKTESSKPTDKKEPVKESPLKEGLSEAERRSLTQEKVEVVPENRAFYYQFAHRVPHQVPQPVERIDEDITKTEEIESHQPQSATPLEAAPQETIFKTDGSKDLASKNSPPISQEPSTPTKDQQSVGPVSKQTPVDYFPKQTPQEYVPMQAPQEYGSKQTPQEYDSKQTPEGYAPNQSPHDYVSARAFNLGAIPVAAVHDAQVSPLQRPFVPNYHLRPIYVPPVLK